MKGQKPPHPRKPHAAGKAKHKGAPSKPSPKVSTKPPSSAAPGDPGSTGAGPSAAPLPTAPGGPLLPLLASPPPTPPAYGFHNLDRRTIVLADGSVRSYFALPPDAPDNPAADRFPPFHGGRFSPEGFRGPLPPPAYGRGEGPQQDYWSSLGLDGPRGPPEGLPSFKRKYGEEDDLMWRRQPLLQYGNPEANTGGFRPHSPLCRDHLDDARPSKLAKVGGEDYVELNQERGRGKVDVPLVAVDVDPEALNMAFLRFSKAINEDASVRKTCLEDGKKGPLRCLACGRTSEEFADVHELIMHAYSVRNADLRVDHLGFHKALCVLMGWDYSKLPDSSKAYQLLSTDAATLNKEDLILWPPTVIVHNTSLGRRRDGRMEGMGNKEMDNKLKELGFGGGKSKSIYGKEGHTGLTLVKFANNQGGLNDAERLAEYFEKDNCGRRGWARVEALCSSDDDGKNPALVKVDEKTGEKKRILYGYLATASDLDKVDFETRKKVVIKSRKEHA